MRLLTWNLWWRFGPWERRRAAIDATLAAVGADVICLQETWPDQARDLAERLDCSWVFEGRARRDGHTGEPRFGVAVLSRWPIVARVATELPIPSDEDVERVAVMVTLDVPGGPVDVVTTHLSHRPEWTADRIRQLEWTRHLANVGRTGDLPPVLAGDLNSRPRGAELARARQLGLQECWSLAPTEGTGLTMVAANPYLHGGFKDLGDAGIRLDHVLVGEPAPGDRRWVVTNAEVASSSALRGVWPSDHLGVIVDLDAPGLLAERVVRSADRIQVAVSDVGTGPPVMLLHGLAGSGDDWWRAGAVDRLAAAGRRVLVVDLRGHGRSTRPTDPAAYAIEHLVADVAAVAALVDGDEPIDLVGWGLGAIVAEAAVAADGRFRCRALAPGVTASEPDLTALAARNGLRPEPWLAAATQWAHETTALVVNAAPDELVAVATLTAGGAHREQ